jgi:hypothetical protein
MSFQIPGGDEAETQQQSWKGVASPAADSQGWSEGAPLPAGAPPAPAEQLLPLSFPAPPAGSFSHALVPPGSPPLAADTLPARTPLEVPLPAHPATPLGGGGSLDSPLLGVAPSQGSLASASQEGGDGGGGGGAVSPAPPPPPPLSALGAAHVHHHLSDLHSFLPPAEFPGLLNAALLAVAACPRLLPDAEVRAAQAAVLGSAGGRALLRGVAARFGFAWGAARAAPPAAAEEAERPPGGGCSAETDLDQADHPIYRLRTLRAESSAAAVAAADRGECGAATSEPYFSPGSCGAAPQSGAESGEPAALPPPPPPPPFPPPPPPGAFHSGAYFNARYAGNDLDRATAGAAAAAAAAAAGSFVGPGAPAGLLRRDDLGGWLGRGPDRRAAEAAARARAPPPPAAKPPPPPARLPPPPPPAAAAPARPQAAARARRDPIQWLSNGPAPSTSTNLQLTDSGDEAMPEGASDFAEGLIAAHGARGGAVGGGSGFGAAAWARAAKRARREAARSGSSGGDDGGALETAAPAAPPSPPRPSSPLPQNLEPSRWNPALRCSSGPALVEPCAAPPPQEGPPPAPPSPPQPQPQPQGAAHCAQRLRINGWGGEASLEGGAPPPPPTPLPPGTQAGEDGFPSDSELLDAGGPPPRAPLFAARGGGGAPPALRAPPPPLPLPPLAPKLFVGVFGRAFSGGAEPSPEAAGAAEAAPPAPPHPAAPPQPEWENARTSPAAAIGAAGAAAGAKRKNTQQGINAFFGPAQGY